MARRRGFGPEVDSAINMAAQRYGLSPAFLRHVAQIESSGQPGRSSPSGSHHGLFMLSPNEFQRGGGQGSPFDPGQNAMAAAAGLAGKRDVLAKALGRPPTDAELYLAHQQGLAGAQAHLANPDRPAWMNMNDASGRGEAWSRRAISGNIPESFRHLGPDLTSRQFMDAWRNQFEPEIQLASNQFEGTQRAPAPAAQVGINPLGTPAESQGPTSGGGDQPVGGDWDYQAGVAVSPYREPKPFFEQNVPPSWQNPPSLQNVNTAAPIVAGLKSFGGALSAAGKTLMQSSQIRLPALDDPGRQMAALDSRESWPTIPVRPRRPFGPRG